MYKAKPEAIIRCYVCGRGNTTLFSIKTKTSTAYVCKEHNVSAYTEHAPIDAGEKSRFTKQEAQKIRTIQLLQKRQQEAIKKVASAKEYGIIK